MWLFFSERSQWQIYLVRGGVVNFASACYCKMWKSRDCQVKMEWFSRRSWSQPAAARYWELCSPYRHSTCRQEPGTLKNKWYVRKNLKQITESRVLKILLQAIFPAFLVCCVLDFHSSVMLCHLSVLGNFSLMSSNVWRRLSYLYWVFLWICFFIWLSMLWKVWKHSPTFLLMR